MVGYLAYDVVRRLEVLPDDNVDDLGLPELVMMLVSDMAIIDHHTGEVAGRQRDQLRRRARAGRARLERCPRPRARHGRDAEQAGGTAARGARRRGRGSRRAAPEYARAVHGRRRVSRRRDQGGRGVSDRAEPAVRRVHRRRPARHLPHSAPHQPQPVPLPAAGAGAGGGRLKPRGAGHRAERTGRNPPDRRVTSTRANRRRRRGARSRTAGRPQGAGRAPDAGRLGPQRSGPGVRARHGRGGRVHESAPLQPHHASRGGCDR
ncbi:MAG: hypothetical protein R2742_10550 [Micropruina glycogenica]